MFYIKLEKDKDLIITTVDPIYRGDNLNQKIIYLIPKTVGDIEITSARLYLNYIYPDGSSDVDELDRMEKMYNESYYQYTLPITCELSRKVGDVCMWLEIRSGDAVSKTGECTISIFNSKNIDDYIEDQNPTPTPSLIGMLHQVQEDLDEHIVAAGEEMESIREDIDALGRLPGGSGGSGGSGGNGVGIKDIYLKETTADGNVYTIVLTDDRPYDFVAPKGDPGAGVAVDYDAERKAIKIRNISGSVSGEPVPGKDGKSAYEIAVDEGFEGSVAVWLASLKGADGRAGYDGKDGAPGKDGANGLPGQDGKDGKDGKDGVSPTINVSNITGGYRVSITDAESTKTIDLLNGKDGKNGIDGKDGIATKEDIIKALGYTPEKHNVAAMITMNEDGTHLFNIVSADGEIDNPTGNKLLESDAPVKAIYQGESVCASGNFAIADDGMKIVFDDVPNNQKIIATIPYDSADVSVAFEPFNSSGVSMEEVKDYIEETILGGAW